MVCQKDVEGAAVGSNRRSNAAKTASGGLAEKDGRRGQLGDKARGAESESDRTLGRKERSDRQFALPLRARGIVGRRRARPDVEAGNGSRRRERRFFSSDAVEGEENISRVSTWSVVFLFAESGSDRLEATRLKEEGI